jgi:hypothetical protein
MTFTLSYLISVLDWQYINFYSVPIQWVLGVLSLGLSGQGMKLTPHLHVVLMLGMHGAMPSLPHVSSRHGS